MIVRWDNPEETYVRVHDGKAVHLIPVDDAQAEWQSIKAKVEAGELVIGPYELPASDD